MHLQGWMRQWQGYQTRSALADQHCMLTALRLKLTALVAWKVEADRLAVQRLMITQ
jgi:hypothetical protein